MRHSAVIENVDPVPYVQRIGLAPAKRVKRLLNDVSPTPYSIWELVKRHSTAASLSWQGQGLCYMGVGETSFNSRFTLLAGARPMLYGSWWNIIQQPFHFLGRGKAYAIWELVKHHSTTDSLSWQVQGLCYLGVGETSFNNRFTLLAGVTPMRWTSPEGARLAQW